MLAGADAHVGRGAGSAGRRRLDRVALACDGSRMGTDPGAVHTPEPDSVLLERSGQLAALRDAHARTIGGRGTLVLLAGEAGGGKTALLRRAVTGFAAAGARMLWGGCDPLFTPRPLGPFLDMAHDAGGDLLDACSAGAKPYQVADALAREARRGRGAPSSWSRTCTGPTRPRSTC